MNLEHQQRLLLKEAKLKFYQMQNEKLELEKTFMTLEHQQRSFINKEKLKYYQIQSNILLNQIHDSDYSD